MDSEIWGVIETVMGYRIIYLKRWPPDITAFKKYRCPGPAPDLLSQNLGPGSRRGTGSQCSWSKPADRKGAWGLAVADWSKSWVKIFSPTALAGGPKFFFSIRPEPAPGAVSGTTSAFPDYANFVWLGGKLWWEHNGKLHLHLQTAEEIFN